jgi:TolB-like protein
MSESTKAVFLSYASQDVAAALRIYAALRAAGIEVWFDQDALVGGDAWDQKIRGQVGACALFVPVISAHTQERQEGYFRLEWHLAEQRSLLIAKGRPFIVPVSIDATGERGALVPEAFTAVQWTKLSGGETAAAFVARVQKLLGGPSAPVATAAPTSSQPSSPAQAARSGLPLWVTVALGAVVLALVAFVMMRPSGKDATAAAEPLTGIKPTPAVVPASAPLVPVAIAPAAVLSAMSSVKASATTEALAKPDAKSVAVLAFANMSADKDTEYFSDGISEEILNALANNPSLRVAGRTSSFSFKGKNATNVEIGRALSVARVIEGSVRKAGNKVRITVQLINAADGYNLWSEAFDRDLTDIFAVQSEIAAKVAQKLAGGLATPAATVTVAAGAQTKNLAAYDAYLRGRASRHESKETQEAYEEAVRLDPDYALAWARLSHSLVRLRLMGRDGGDTRGVQASKAAETAVKLAPDLPEAHLAMALIRLHVDRDHEAAQRELAIADRLRPSDAEVAEAQAQLEWVRGRWGPQLAALVMRSAELDPLNPNLGLSCRILTEVGRFAEANKLGQHWLELTPDSLGARMCQSDNHLIWTGDISGALAILILETASDGPQPRLPILRSKLHAMKGDFTAAIADYNQMNLQGRSSGKRIFIIFATLWTAQLEARQGNVARAAELYDQGLAAAREFVTDFPELADGPTHLAVLHADRGERPEALAALEKAMQLAMATRDAPYIVQTRRMKAFVHATLGEKAAAIAELRTIHATGFAFGYLLRRELEWEPLRGEAKFQQLMKEAEARADGVLRPKK